MIPSSFTTRAVRFAYLIGPPQTLSRQDAMGIHDSVCQKLGADDFAFQYRAIPSDEDLSEAPRGQSRGFEIKFVRQQGRGTFNITIDHTNIENPVRFLCQYTWPPSRELVYQDFDLASEALFETLGSDWQRVLAETRVRGQVEAQGDSAARFMSEHVLGLTEAGQERLEAPVSFVTAGYETPATDPSPEDQLQGPKREVTLEVLREDRRSLYLEVMSQWPQIARVSNGTMKIDAQRLRQFDAEPSEYIGNSVDYIHEIALPLFND